jgi:allophanate hydrolase
MVSTHGVVPACASLDCVAVFGTTCQGTLHVESVIAGHDDRDAHSKCRTGDTSFELGSHSPSEYTVGVPESDYLEFFGDTEAKSLFESARTTVEDGFAECVEVEFEPFVATAELLYGGPWLAERLLAIEEFVETHPDAMHPVVETVVTDGANYSALDTFRAFHELEALQQAATAVFEDIDVLVTPTVGTMYTVEEIREKPVERNSDLGYYTDYVNLLDLAAVAVPTGTFGDGPGFGVTVLGEATDDDLVAAVGERIRLLTDGPDTPPRDHPDSEAPPEADLD